MRQVTFVIKKDGKIITDFDGFTGESCITESEKIFSALRESGVQGSQESIENKPDKKVRILNEL